MSSLKKFSYLFRGFTLVELIVVISVLAVLATIAISQISNITSSARDSQRLTDITSMKSALENYTALKGILPIPSSSTAIVYSGGTVWTQGTFGESVVRTLKSISPKPIDPKYNLEYVYSVANTGKEYELGGVLEKVSGMNFPISQPLPQGRGVVGKEVVGAFPRKALPTPLSKAFLQGWALFDETSTNLKSLKGVRGTNLSFDKFAPALSSFFSPSPLGEGARGWGLENSLFDTVSAASAQNIAVVKGNYPGLSLKVVTGSTTYVLAVPTLIAQDTASGNILNIQLVIDGKWSLPKGFAQSVTSTAQTGTFVPTLAWSGEKLPTTQTGIAQMVQWLQTAYNGSSATSLSQISSLISATWTQITVLWQGLIQNSLGGTAVALPVETTTSYTYSWTGSTWSACSLSCGGGTQTRTVTCQNNSGTTVADSSCTEAKPTTSQSCNIQACSFFAGGGTTGDPWKKADGTALTSCQAYNTGANMLNNGSARGAGACGNGSQACLSDGIYNINPDGLGVLSVYCDMTDNGGGWTKLMHANYSNFFTTGNWSNLNANNPESATLYSILNKRDAFKVDGKYTFRFQIGRTGAVSSYKSTLSNSNIWKQTHDPFTQTTNGSDYEYVSGEASTTCNGFNWLHAWYQAYSMATDVDSADSYTCWWMQAVPITQYGAPPEYYYLDGYGGIHHSHVWQILWLK